MAYKGGIARSQPGRSGTSRADFSYARRGYTMEMNPYQYDNYVRTVPRVPRRSYMVGAGTCSINRHSTAPALEGSPKSPERMPKARALALARTLKKWLVVASLASFSIFSGLVAYHQVGTTATSTKSGESKQTTASATPSSSQTSNSNNFFKQQGGNNFGSNSSSSTSFSGSSVS